jgi:polysaccharide biosynthesis/export protein
MSDVQKGRPRPALFCARYLRSSGQPSDVSSTRVLTRLLKIAVLLPGIWVLGVPAWASDTRPSSTVVQAFADHAQVSVLGDVVRPGSYPASAKVSEVLLAAGGLRPSAYPLGAVLLRPAHLKALPQPCLRRSAQVLQAQLSLSPGLASGQLDALIQAAAVGQMQRLPVEVDRAVLAVAPDRDSLLGGGDVLYIPSRPQTVAVLGDAPLGLQVFRHAPGQLAEDYLVPGLSPRFSRRRHTLYLPNGALQPLQLSYWNYRKEVVPPGSVILVEPPLSRQERRECQG